jgi:hypothetical protein
MDRSRQTRRRAREIAAAVGVVLAGAAAVTTILTVDPRWQAIIAATRASWAASVRLGTPGVAGGMPAPVPLVEPRSAPAAGLESSVVVSAQPAGPPGPRPAATPSKPARSEGSTRSGAHAPTVIPDPTHVMVNFLVAQLGHDPAWRTALANADAHAPGSPEFIFWHQVAASIRENATRPRP